MAQAAYWASHKICVSLGWCIAALILSGCASAPPMVESTSVRQLAYPPPPQHARYVYERSVDSATFTARPGWRQRLTGEEDKTTPGMMGKPYAVAVHDRRVFVSDMEKGIVWVFDIRAKRSYILGAAGPVRLHKPLGLSVDRAGRLYVADAAINTIVVFDQQGAYLRTIGGPQWFIRLASVTADPQGDRIYAVDSGGGDSGTPRVRAFDPVDGRHLFDFGGSGAGAGELNLPVDLAVGREGRLYVVDSGNFRIQIFDRAGRYLKSFGAAGKKPGQFSRPKEVAADAEGNIYVVDASFANVQVFDPDGAWLFAIGGGGEEAGGLKLVLPSGIDIDQDGSIYLLDQWLARIAIFRPLHAEVITNHDASSNSFISVFGCFVSRTVQL